MAVYSSASVDLNGLPILSVKEILAAVTSAIQYSLVVLVNKRLVSERTDVGELANDRQESTIGRLSLCAQAAFLFPTSEYAA
jgi:hypothetical protein